jgi:hypothetical protein
MLGPSGMWCLIVSYQGFEGTYCLSLNYIIYLEDGSSMSPKPTYPLAGLALCRYAEGHKLLKPADSVII